MITSREDRVKKRKLERDALQSTEKRMAADITINVFYDKNGNISIPKQISVNSERPIKDSLQQIFELFKIIGG